MRILKMIGGPFDGMEIPDNEGYFLEGQLEAVEVRDLSVSEKWGKASVYECRGDRLVYNTEATSELRKQDGSES